MPAIQKSEPSLADFFQKLFRQTQGYVYLALKSKTGAFQQHFFEWPAELPRIEAFIEANKDTYDVYFGPALYREKEVSKRSIIGSYCFWIELDHDEPPAAPPEVDIPGSSIQIQSSTTYHRHIYWLLEEMVDVQVLESVNRSLSYILGADHSGWDATQILRPFGTLNHKRKTTVTVLQYTDIVYSAAAIQTGLPSPPPLVEIDVPEKIPAVEDVIASYKMPPTVWALFKSGVGEGKRSDGLMSLGYYLAEMGMTAEECMAVLLNADARWGKFGARDDKFRRLSEIITIARAKFPSIARRQQEQTEKELHSIGFNDVLTSNVVLKWIWQDYLQEMGYLLLTGPSGVGKTQFCLNLAACMVLEEPFLGRPVVNCQKVGMFSLEMGLTDLQHFMRHQEAAVADTPEKMQKLQNNLRVFALGEPLYLTDPKVRKTVENVIQREELKVVMFDSLGSCTDGDLSKETSVKPLLDWNDHLRQEFGVSTVFIHHHRKASGDNRKPNKLSDVYGNQYITARATTVLCMWPQESSNSISLIPLKIRLAPRKGDTTIHREPTLTFRVGEGVIIKPKTKSNQGTAPGHSGSQKPKATFAI